MELLSYGCFTPHQTWKRWVVCMRRRARRWGSVAHSLWPPVPFTAVVWFWLSVKTLGRYVVCIKVPARLTGGSCDMGGLCGWSLKVCLLWDRDAMLQWKQLVRQDLVVMLAYNDLACGSLLVVIGNNGWCQCYRGYIVQWRWRVDIGRYLSRCSFM